MSTFVVPKIADNPNGWGPNAEIAITRRVPYAPFNKSDRVGRISDWNAHHHYNRRNKNKDVPVNKEFNYQDSAGSEFKTVVEATKKYTSYTGQRRFNFHQKSGQRIRREREAQREKTVRGKAAKHLHKTSNGRRQKLARMRYASYKRWGQNEQEKQHLERSVTPQEQKWSLVSEFMFNELSSVVPLDRTPDCEDVHSCGSVGIYGPAWNAVSTKRHKTLEAKFAGAYPQHVAASEDPVMQGLAGSQAASSSSADSSSAPAVADVHVFVTDAVLSALMCCRRSKWPWDIVVRKKGKDIFFDKREQSKLDQITHDETSHESLPSTEDASAIDQTDAIALESTIANANFTQQVSAKQRKAIPLGADSKELSIAEERELSRAYRYRRFHLDLGTLIDDNESNESDDDDSEAQARKSWPVIDVYVRCQIDATTTVAGERKWLTIHALTETDGSPQKEMDWRKKLDTQQSAILATLLKDNAFLFSRWCSEALLADAEKAVIGFVSRTTPKNNAHHVILGTATYNPEHLAAQVHVSLRHQWSLFFHIARSISTMADGSYALLREPSQPILSLFLME